MTLKKHKPVTSGLRNRVSLDSSSLAKGKPEKNLSFGLKKRGGRNSRGKVTVRHRGGGVKRKFRVIDFGQSKKGIEARVAAIEYDPNRTANIALLFYKDGEKRYILAPEELKEGDRILIGEKASLEKGNRLPLAKIPVGMSIYNIELRPGSGGKIVKSAGGQAFIQAKEEGFATVKLPSSEVRKISLKCWASLGQVSNPGWRNVSLGKAGRKRHLGIRPAVRGVAMHPGAHPHGGGEGRSGVGMPSPKSPWGKRVKGVKTRKRRKHTSKYIVKRRK